MHGRENRQFKSDSLKIASSHLQFSNNSSLLKKEIDKPSNSQISKSFIQWTANLVKNTVQILVDVIVEAARVILVTIIQFFIG